MKSTRWTKADLARFARLTGAPGWLHVLDIGLWRDANEADYCRVTCWIRAWLRKRGVDVRYRPIKVRGEGPDWSYIHIADETEIWYATERDAILAAVRHLESETKGGGKCK